MPSFVTHLECTRCGKRYDHRVLQTLCHDCGRPLYARYDLPAIRAARMSTIRALAGAA